MAKTSGVVEASSLHTTHGGLRVPPQCPADHPRQATAGRTSPVRRPIAHVAAEMGISRPTAHKWVLRWRAEGDTGLIDRSSRPRLTPHRTSPALEPCLPAAAGAEARSAQDRADPGPAPLDGPPDPHPARIEPPGMARPQDRHRDPPLRTRAARRELGHVDVKNWAGSRTAAVTGPWAGPPGRRAAGRQGGRAAGPRDGLRLCALRRRRSHPTRLQRDPPRRQGRDLRRSGTEKERSQPRQMTMHQLSVDEVERLVHVLVPSDGRLRASWHRLPGAALMAPPSWRTRT